MDLNSIWPEPESGCHCDLTILGENEHDNYYSGTFFEMVNENEISLTSTLNSEVVSGDNNPVVPDERQYCLRVKRQSDLINVVKVPPQRSLLKKSHNLTQVKVLGSTSGSYSSESVDSVTIDHSYSREEEIENPKSEFNISVQLDSPPSDPDDPPETTIPEKINKNENKVRFTWQL